MAQSLDALTAFVEAASQGSFSAAARQLGKRQSTISEAIANLEIEYGVQLFDRTHHTPHLTHAGRILLQHAQRVLLANDSLSRCASELAQGRQLEMTIAISDIYQADGFTRMMALVHQRTPELALECLIAEDADVVWSVEQGRAHIGLLAAMASYPAHIRHFTLEETSEVVLVVAPGHALARLKHVRAADLAHHRELRIQSFEKSNVQPRSNACWSTSHYLVLLEMVLAGYGWARLPKWLVENYAPGRLHELGVPGWPKHIAIDAIWSSRYAVGSVSAWLLALLERGFKKEQAPEAPR